SDEHGRRPGEAAPRDLASRITARSTPAGTGRPMTASTAVVQRRRRTRRLSDLEPTLLPLAVLVAVLVLWEGAARLDLVPAFFFSSPSAIVASGARNIFEPEFWNDV